MKPDERKCPSCAETIKADAKVCKHCQRSFTDAEIAAAKKAQATAQAIGGVGCVALLVLLVGFCSFAGGTDPKEQAAAAAKSAEDKRRGFHCLSAWDGSNRSLVDQVKAQLRDPDSFDHAETSITPAGPDGKHTIAMQYRARNGFGGMNVETALGTVDHESCEATVARIGA